MSDPPSIPQVEPWLGEEEAIAASKVIATNWISEGPNCAAFSERLRDLIGTPYGVFAPNGTLALALALMALGLGPGDEVLIPDITFIGSANAAIMVGATPIFVDVDSNTYQISLSHADALITPRTRAIMPVHLYGTACDMEAVQAFAMRHALKIVEDAAQGIGVFYRERHVGSFGDAGCFSFFSDKTVTTGEGGYVACRDPGLHEHLRFLRNQGRQNAGSFVHPMIGYNFRITDVQAAIGLVQLSKLDKIIARKREIHAWYQQDLAELSGVRILAAAPNSTVVPFRCVLLAPRAHELMTFLSQRGVQSRSIFYPMHRQPCFAKWFDDKPYAPSLRDDDYPNAVAGYEHGLCLPVFPTLRRDQVAYIVQQIIEFYDRGTP
jgi:perosamine synthetase